MSLKDWNLQADEEHGLQKAEQITYYSTSEVGSMSKKVRIMVARAIMDS